MKQATYCGPNLALEGKTALIRQTDDHRILEAQFDDINTGYGNGWHKFKWDEFYIEVTVMNVEDWRTLAPDELPPEPFPFIQEVGTQYYMASELVPAGRPLSVRLSELRSYELVTRDETRAWLRKKLKRLVDERESNEAEADGLAETDSCGASRKPDDSGNPGPQHNSGVDRTEVDGELAEDRG